MGASMSSGQLQLMSTALGLGLGCLAALACGGPGRPAAPTNAHPAVAATTSAASVDGYRLVKPPVIVREDSAGEASSVSVYFRVNRRLPRGSYATVDGQQPESRVLTRFVPKNDRCYRLDAGGTKKSPWMNVPLGTPADFRLHVRGHDRVLTARAPLQAPLPVERNANGIGSEGLAYERRLNCLRAGRAR
jgi:hypothetical protein